jgi:hypothetical protein
VILAVAVLLTFAALANAASSLRGGPATSALREAPAPNDAASSAAGFPVASSSRALKITDPIGHLANANSVVPAFELGFSYSQVRVGQLKLKAILIRPVSADEFVKGGCTACTGSGRFLPYTIRGHLFQESAKGPIFMTRRTKIAEALIRPGEIGRFKVYGVSVGSLTTTVLLAHGCIAADAIPVAGGTSTALLDALLHPQTLPQVPCSGNPTGDNVTFFRPPFELSATQPAIGGFSGHAGGPRWLSVFQGRKPCAPDPLAEATGTPNHVFWHISGDFRKGFTTATDTKPGFFCAYLQSGGTFGRIPDGRLGLMWSAPYYAGDTIAISGQSTAAANQTAVDTFAGHASVREQFWSFDSFTPCAGTAQGEFPTAFGLSNSSVKGNFSIAVTSVPLSRSVFRCGYLQVGAPSHGKPTGPTVAKASLAITVQ